MNPGRKNNNLKQLMNKPRTMQRVLMRANDNTGPTGPAGPTGPTGETSGVPQIITFISQQEVTNAGGILIISNAGNYCLQENIIGTLVIAVNHVCLDLCCFTLSAGGANNAIIANNVDDIQIFNGGISESTKEGILLTKCNSISIDDLRMFDHLQDMIRVRSCSSISITEVIFDSNNNGERAIHFHDSNGISIDLCEVSGFISTVGSLIELINCDTVSVQNVDIYGNTKSLHKQNAITDETASFLHASDSTGVYMQYVKFNNNIINNKNPGNRYFNALSFVDCISSSLYHIETGNNVNLSGAAPNAIAIDSMIYASGCSNFITIDCQLNDNRMEAPITGFFGVHIVDSQSIAFYGCQANSNYVKSLPYNPSSESNVAGFFFESIQTNETEDNVIGNCQANYNRVEDAGVRPGGGLVARLCGIITEGSMLIDYCQTNHNTIGTNGIGQFAGGILGLKNNNVSITNSVSNDNTGGQFSFGFQMRALANISQSNSKIMNCTANSNGNFGIIIGNQVLDKSDLVENINIVNCTCNKNGNEKTEAAGILIVNNVSNVLVKSCQVTDTFSFDTYANGIYVKNASNITIDDTIINTTAGKSMSHGIVFENAKNSKIVRSQMTGNCGSGVEIIGCVNNSIAIIECTANCNDKGYSVNSQTCLTNGLFKENIAMNNTTVGYEHGPENFATGYISNYAQGNAQDYLINGGVIALHNLGFNNGKTKNVSGNEVVSHWSNISAF